MTHLDLRLLATSAAFWLATILTLYEGAGVTIALTAVLAAVWLGGFAIRRHGILAKAAYWGPTIAVVAVVACLASLVTAMHVRAREGPITQAVGTTVEMTGRIASYPSISTAVYSVLEVDALEGESGWVGASGSVRLVGEDDLGQVSLGSRVHVRVSLDEADRTDEHLAWARVRSLELIEQPTGVAGFVARRADLVDQRLADQSPAVQGLVPGLAIGDDSKLPPQSEEAMQGVNLTHLTAVSGAHVSMLCAIVLVIVGARRRVLSVLACAVTLLVLLIATGWQASVMRAAFMGGVVLLALAMRRPSSALPTLGAAIIGLLLANPFLALSYGFILSACSTAAIIAFTGPVSSLLEPLLGRVSAAVFSVPIVAHLACAPIVALLSPTSSIWSALANALAGPVVPIGTVSSLAGFLLAPWALAEPFLTVAAWAVTWIDAVGQELAGWPGSNIPASYVVATYLGLLCASFLVGKGLRRRYLLALGAGSAIAYLLAPSPAWTILACDVGQGTAVAVRTASGTFLFDTGSESANLDRCMSRYDADPDVLVLTHLHEDHAGHAPRLSATIPTYVGAGLTEQAHKLGITVTGELTAGTQLGPFTVIGPQVIRYCETSSCENDQSLVLRGDKTIPVLITGDIESDTQANLARGDIASDIIVVPHHGSPNFDTGFVHAVGARYAIISVGENDYGHPAPAVIDAYAAHGRVMRTDESDVLLYWEGDDVG